MGGNDPPDPRKKAVNSEKPVSKKFKSGDSTTTTSIKTNCSDASTSSPNQTIHNHITYDEKQILYPDIHPGPYYVLINTENQVSTRTKNSELHLFEKLENLKIPGNFESKNIGFNTFRLSFNNANAANDLVLNTKLNDIGMRAYIPDRFLQKYYIIKNVPINYSGERIINEINLKNIFTAVSVYRFTYKNEETIKVGIIYDSPLTEFNMFCSKAKVELYVPPTRLCKNCGRLGHIAVRCKSKKRCLFCGADIICPNDCKEQKCSTCLSSTKCPTVCKESKCILCNRTDHNANDSRICDKWKTEKTIKAIMALSNKSKKECLQTYKRTNYYEILDEEQFQNQFPSLNKKQNQPAKTMNEEINRRITKMKYSKVVKLPPKRDLPTASPLSVNPTKPAFLYPNFRTTSEFEKIFSFFASQMSSILNNINCPEGLKILEQFRKAMQSVPESVNENSQNKTHSNHDKLSSI
ncbi:uncharacterized protein LOC142221602 [Haematobia irritans]|uniref:uncharacterized protein LOC142221602 n=1 Tax=Haematobia irritans TaxID=7368 RepID=UPI003F507128